ncbi:MAG TPA: flavodoxin domain-containing protein [Gemmatimonadaceae bacterium]|nr:flavodoxin domain-containing protein [Gemmatimonadaceae bacterium]
MRDQRILIIYATSYGQTGKIATRMAEVLRRSGYDVTVVDARENGERVRLETFDGVIIGASLIARGLQPAVDRFVRANLDALNRLPTLFFQVSASAGSTRPEGRDAAQRLLDRYLSATGLRPDLSASIAGAINYTRYNPLLRWYMKRASKLNGGSTDTSRDHEYTDWVQVEAIANGFVERALQPEQAFPGPARHP